MLVVIIIDPLQVTPPVDWDVRPEDGGAYQEEGSNNMELSRGPAKKQKWMKKRTAKRDYLYFDYETDMLADPFLASVTSEERNRWYPDLQEQLKKTEECGGVEGEDGVWYFVFSGPGCGLYKSYTWFTATRDEDMEWGGSSKKATRFGSLEEAKAWIQGSRDEEGDHWGWPNPMPIFY